MSLEALCDFFHLPKNFHIAPPEPEQNILKGMKEEDAYLLMYNPEQDSIKLKEHPELFEYLRGNYPLRREKEAYLRL